MKQLTTNFFVRITTAMTTTTTRLAATLLVTFIATIIACTKSSNSDTAPAANSVAPAQTWAFKVGIVLDKGGRDDKSFNTAAVKGGELAQKELGIEVKIVESPDDAAYESAMRNFAERGYQLIIVIGFSQRDALAKVAPQFANTKFAIVDSSIDQPNIASLMFAEHEGSFLVGAIAGMKSKTDKVGFLGGMEIDLIRRFELGYKEGVKYTNPKAQVIVNYAGITSDAWVNPTKGKELALNQYSQGADVIFTAAGATNMGVFDAAESKKLFAIGVDSNQNYIKPGFILTSMLKRVDVAVYDIIKLAKENKFQPGLNDFTLANKGIDYAIDEYNKKLFSDDELKKIETIKADIMSGKIKVSDYYVTKKLNKK